jgi:long-chain-alcohol oxidase
VVDEDGEMWECDGVYLCDASVFPTASGSNPMMTTLATACMLTERLALRLQHQVFLYVLIPASFTPSFIVSFSTPCF